MILKGLEIGKTLTIIPYTAQLCLKYISLVLSIKIIVQNLILLLQLLLLLLLLLLLHLLLLLLHLLNILLLLLLKLLLAKTRLLLIKLKEILLKLIILRINHIIALFYHNFQIPLRIPAQKFVKTLTTEQTELKFSIQFLTQLLIQLATQYPILLFIHNLLKYLMHPISIIVQITQSSPIEILVFLLLVLIFQSRKPLIIRHRRQVPLIIAPIHIKRL